MQSTRPGLQCPIVFSADATRLACQGLPKVSRSDGSVLVASMVSVRLRGPAPTPATESRAVSSGNNPRSLHESREVAWRPGRAQCWGCRLWGPQSGASRRHPSPDLPATAPANLVTFWVGCLIASFSFPLIPLMVLHIMPMFRSLSEGMATPGHERHRPAHSNRLKCYRSPC